MLLGIVVRLQQLLSLQLESRGHMQEMSEEQWSEYEGRNQEIDTLFSDLIPSKHGKTTRQ